MSSIALSVILYAAFHSGRSCETVFTETARAVNPSRSLGGELVQLKELAAAACQSTNPDIIWKIAQTESNFRFVIARDNSHSRVFRGQAARNFVAKLGQKKTANVDIGVLQLNWAWHGHQFQNDPTRMLQASEQVNYLLEDFGHAIYKRCSEKWIGCYHHPSNEKAALAYEKQIKKSGRLLRSLSLGYVQDLRANLSAEQKAELPPLRAKDWVRIAREAEGLPPPVREFLNFASILQMDAVRVAYQIGISS